MHINMYVQRHVCVPIYTYIHIYIHEYKQIHTVKAQSRHNIRLDHRVIDHFSSCHDDDDGDDDDYDNK
jgi:hypothetical protein